MIGDTFAWAHLPKTAGDATAMMLAAVPGLVRFADPPDSDDKHAPFFAREAEVRGKLLVMNFRRLPAWILSAAHHRAAHGLSPDYRPLPLETPDEMVEKTDPDDLLRWMTDHGRFAVARWLRVEYLLTDVLFMLAELGVLTPAVGAAVRSVGPRNVGSYDRSIADRLTAEQIRRCYDRNPEWARLERSLYGDLLSD